MVMNQRPASKIPRRMPRTADGFESRRVTTTDLYRHFSADGRLLYVGISLNAIARLTQHNTRSGWAAEIAAITIERHPDRNAALAAEAAAIAKERPVYNVSGRWAFDDDYDPAEERAKMERIFATSRDEFIAKTSTKKQS